MPGEVVVVAMKSAQWRRGEHPVIFTHQETGEQYQGHGIVGVGFDVVVPNEFENGKIPAQQLRFYNWYDRREWSGTKTPTLANARLAEAMDR